jgi:hypothetical protein
MATTQQSWEAYHDSDNTLLNVVHTLSWDMGTFLGYRDFC